MTFVDTGAFLARYSTNDQYHREAVRLWPTLQPPVVTSNHVVDELATALGRLAGYGFAADRVADIYASAVIDVVPLRRHSVARRFQPDRERRRTRQRRAWPSKRETILVISCCLLPDVIVLGPPLSLVEHVILYPSCRQPIVICVSHKHRKFIALPHRFSVATQNLKS